MRTQVRKHVSAIVLAAGLSRRMGPANKLLLPFEGRTVLEHAVRAVQGAPVAETVVVTGHEDAAARAALAGLDVRVVRNAAYAEGMASSIRCGVEAAAPTASGYLIGLGDMPLLDRETPAFLCARFAEKASPEAICVPVFGGQRGHPVLFGRAHRAALRCLKGDGGARPVLLRHPSAVLEVAVEDAGVVRDVDTPAAYQRLTGPAPAG